MFNRHSLRQSATGTICSAILISSFSLAFSLPASSQSTDFSRPTPITQLPLVGEHDGGQDVARYYGFEAGPGEVLITFDGHASRYSTSARAKVYDANRNLLGDLSLAAMTSPSSVTKRITLAKKQRLVLELSFHQDTSMGVLSYSVNMSGNSIRIAKEGDGAVAAESTSSGQREPIAATTRSSRSRLHIELRDGTSRDFDMSTVKRIVVE